MSEQDKTTVPATRSNPHGYYQPTEAECRCLVCGALLALPTFWFDVLPPNRNCPEGAKVVTDCRQQMEGAKARAWLLKGPRHERT